MEVNPEYRSHTKIVRDFGATELMKVLEGAGHEMARMTTARWGQRNSIPGNYWKVLADNGVATLEELAAMVPETVESL